MHITPYGEKNFLLDYFVGHKHGRMFSCQTKFCIVYCIVFYSMISEKVPAESSLVKQWRNSGFLVTALQSHNDIITAVDCDESMIVSAR